MKSAAADSEARLASFVAKFDAADQRRIREARRMLRTRLPTANELVYDNYNFFVIGYSGTERPSDAILSLAAQAGKLSLCLLHGAGLPDPHGVLRGAGKQTRSIPLPSAATLTEPAVDAMITAAIAAAKAPLPASGRGALIIRSVSTRQRPRRKPS